MLKNTGFVILGILSMAIGIIGIVVPMLPTTPFFVFSSFCFIKGSSKMRKWFESTSLYKKNLITLKEQKGLTLKTKLRILIPFYFFVLFFILSTDALIMRVVFVLLIIIKTFVFFRIKTIPVHASTKKEIVR